MTPCSSNFPINDTSPARFSKEEIATWAVVWFYLREDHCPLAWCRETISNPFTFRFSMKTKKIAFMFKERDDALLFKLTWGGE